MPKPEIITLNGVAYVELSAVSAEERERWRAEHLELNQDDRDLQEPTPPPAISSAPDPTAPPPGHDRPPGAPIYSSDIAGNELPPEVAAALERGEFPEPVNSDQEPESEPLSDTE